VALVDFELDAEQFGSLSIFAASGVAMTMSERVAVQR
jgi:hypothetical protein